MEAGGSMSSLGEIITERSGSILDVAFNRPAKKNAITMSMYAAFADLLNDAVTDDGIRVVLMHGTGDSFTAGDDVGEAGPRARGRCGAAQPAPEASVPRAGSGGGESRRLGGRVASAVGRGQGSLHSVCRQAPIGDTMMNSPATAPALENVLYEKKDGIAYVTLNRPKVLNALNQRTWQDLRAAFEDARDDATVRGVILTGAGDKAFIAGADISEIAHLTAVDAERSSRYGQDILTLVENLGKPVIAAVNGFALGGGCETAMACTIRVASEHARFGQPEVTLGIIPGGGGTQRLPRLVGKGRALQIILSGAMIGAQEAYRIGLVNAVVPATDLIPRAEAILKQIFANAPVAIRFSLEAVNRGLETSQAEGMALEASLFGLCAGTEDKDEGMQAFLQKRAAKFKGR